MHKLTLSTAMVVLFASLNPAYAQRQTNLARDRDSVANSWHFDYDAAKAIARRTDMPLMVVFRCVP